MPYFDKFNTCKWLKSKYIVVSLKNLNAQRFYNCQLWAPSFYILAKTLLNHLTAHDQCNQCYKLTQLSKISHLYKVRESLRTISDLH